MIIFLLGCFLSSLLLAQQPTNAKGQVGTLVGNILDNVTGKPLSFASIQLTSLTDSSRKNNLVADKNGSFIFERVSPGYYRLSLSIMNFVKTTIDSIHVHSDRMDINLGDIRLQELGATLTEVIVYAEKPLIEHKEGKIIYNVSESPLNNGSNAAELLRNLPMLNANPDGTLLLQGRPPLILIDEKPVNLNGQQLADLLESLPANVVEKVEIMTTPPPEYATYPGGVINIITKKGRVGLYERLNISAGTRGETAVSANFNYRSSKLNIFSSLGIGRNEARGYANSQRQNRYTDSINYFFTASANTNRNQYSNARIQTDYEFSKTSSANFVYQGNLNAFTNSAEVFYTNRDSIQNIYKASKRANQYEGNGYSHGLSASFQWKGKNPVEKLQVYTGLSFSKNNNDRDFYLQYLQSNFLPTGLDSTQVQLTDNYTRSFYIHTNYQKPLNDTGTIYLTMGSTFTNHTYHNILSSSFLRKADHVLIGNELLSNDFFFRQSIFTARAAIVIGLGLQWRLITGVQAEHTTSDFQFIKGNSADANNAYWRLLPNITLRKEFSKELNMSWIYRETIRRPGITELNPNIDYSDPYTIRFGNPLILPSLTDNYDFTISYVKNKFNLNTNLGYNRIKHVFNTIRTLIDSGRTQITYQNISDQEEYQGSIWAGITVTPKVRISISSGYTFTKYSLKEKQLYRYMDGSSFYTSCNASYSPDNLSRIEASTRYSSFANPQGKARSNINMSISVQRRFLNKRLQISLAAIDPFGLQQYNGYTNGTNFSITSHSESNTRNFRLSLSYQLSKTMVKSKLDEQQKKEAIQKLSQH